MGSGLEQGSLFHLQGDLITKATLASRAALLGTTSPSVLIYAGLDGWRRQMVEHGHDLYERTLALVHMDPLQVFIDLDDLKCSGVVDRAPAGDLSGAQGGRYAAGPRPG
jgi:hypothetical protein